MGPVLSSAMLIEGGAQSFVRAEGT